MPRASRTWCAWLALFCGSISQRAAQSSVKSCFVRGSVVRYVVLPVNDVNTELLQDSTRVEAKR